MMNEEDFLSGSVQGANATKRELLPVEPWYVAEIINLGARRTTGKADPSKTYTWLDMTLSLTLPQQLAEAQKRDKAQVRYSIGVDLDVNNRIDTAQNANVQLGRVRKAVNQNEEGAEWTPNMLKGAILKVQLRHKIVDEVTYEEVARIAGLNDQTD